MATEKQNNSKSSSISPAEVKKVGDAVYKKLKDDLAEQTLVGQTPLSEAALELYKFKRATMRGYDPTKAAAQAFSDAYAFIQEEARILAGGEIAASIKKRQRMPMVMVTAWDYQNDAPATDDNGDFLPDREQQGDTDAFAPNRGPDDPVNQRYYKACVELGIEVEPKFRQIATAYKKQMSAA